MPASKQHPDLLVSTCLFTTYACGPPLMLNIFVFTLAGLTLGTMYSHATLIKISGETYRESPRQNTVADTVLTLRIQLRVGRHQEGVQYHQLRSIWQDVLQE
jgi:hypothetical protein